MCGIAGIIDFKSPIQNHQDITETFHRNLKHRGPDSKGYYLSESGNALLCHTRLSIIDTSENANQPMESYDTRFKIIFNGEIYNYKELKDIIYKKYGINTNSDTEILLYMYIEHGLECFKYISGMFSFAIWDNVKEEIVIARDPLGIKPLYYHFNNNQLSFCSEIKALIKSKRFDYKLNYEAISSYLLSGYFHEPNTIIDNIYQLESGHCIIFNKNSFSKIEYDKNIINNNKGIGQKETSAIVKNSFEKSVMYHMESDVPVGVFLSGGIDSTSVLSVASKFSKINTLTIGFEEKEWDESYLSKNIAEYYKANHHEYIIKENDVVESLDDFIDTMDQPTVDGMNTYFISRFAKKFGFKVVLSGLGGDELFGGYSSFARMKIINHYINIKNAIFAEKMFKSIIPYKLLKKQKSRLKDLIESDNIFDSYIALRGIFSKNEVLGMMKQISGSDINNFLDINKNMNCNGNINSQTRTLELNNYLKNQLLRDSDVFGMRWSTEIRTPFIDFNFVSQIKALPEKYIFKKNKQILVESLDLPKHILNNKKQGFTFPFQLWIENYLGDEIKNETFPIIDNNNEWYKLWTLFVLKKWIKKNI